MAKVTAGIVDLLGMSANPTIVIANVHSFPAVLKSTGSAFEGFIRDEYTTLVEVSERILSTSVDLEYHFAPVSIPVPTDPKLLDFGMPKNIVDAKGSVWDALGVAERARTATLDIFAVDESASVQVRVSTVMVTFTHCHGEIGNVVQDGGTGDIGECWRGPGDL